MLLAEWGRAYAENKVLRKVALIQRAPCSRRASWCGAPRQRPAPSVSKGRAGRDFRLLVTEEGARLRARRHQ